MCLLPVTKCRVSQNKPGHIQHGMGRRRAVGRCCCLASQNRIDPMTGCVWHWVFTGPSLWTGGQQWPWTWIKLRVAREAGSSLCACRGEVQGFISSLPWKHLALRPSLWNCCAVTAWSLHSIPAPRRNGIEWLSLGSAGNSCSWDSSNSEGQESAPQLLYLVLCARMPSLYDNMFSSQITAKSLIPCKATL